MSFNGSGAYSLPGAALVNGATVSATENNQFRDDVAAALNLCVLKDGQQVITANLPMNSKKLTGLAAGTTAGDSVRFEQLPVAGVDYQTPLTTASSVALGTATIGSLTVNQVAALSTAQISALSVGAITGVLKASSGSVSAATAATDYVSPSVATSFTAVQTPKTGTATISATGTFTYDPSTHGQDCELTATNAITITFAASAGKIVAGTTYRIVVKAGDTSARTYAKGATVLASGGTIPLTSGATTSGSRDVFLLRGVDANTVMIEGTSSDVR